MTAEKLAESAASGDPQPTDLSPTAQVLWLAKAGEWDQAHDDCQTLADTAAGSWIHAWLHRQEGDYGNACYWYRNAGKPANGGVPAIGAHRQFVGGTIVGRAGRTDDIAGRR